jgi:hypothetical protein
MAYLDEYGNPIPEGQIRGNFTRAPALGGMQRISGGAYNPDNKPVDAFGRTIGREAQAQGQQFAQRGWQNVPGLGYRPPTAPTTPFAQEATPQTSQIPGKWKDLNEQQGSIKRAMTAPKEATLALFKTVKGMSGMERQSYLTSLQQNLMQRLQRYQTLLSRGFGGEMDDTAKRDYEAITESLKDVTRLINDPSYLDELMRMEAATALGGMQAGQQVWVPVRANENAVGIYR